MDKKSPLKIYGLLGFPVKHSLSPAMHNAAFRALNLPAEYRLFEVKPEDLEDVLLKDIPIQDTEGNIVNTGNISGLNITIPHKVRAKEILEKRFPPRGQGEIFRYVGISGAVNTVIRNADGTLGYTNTDFMGFCESLKKDLKFNPQDKNVLLIGCGGAGRAVVAGLIWKPPHPKKIYIYEPDSGAEKSAQKHFNLFAILKEKTEFIAQERIPEIIIHCQLLVNASPVGMKGEEVSVVDKDYLPNELHVYDLVYNRERETRLIRDAKSKGLRTQDGLGMLLYQGVKAFEIWTGSEAPVEVMRNALNQAIKR